MIHLASDDSDESESSTCHIRRPYIHKGAKTPCLVVLTGPNVGHVFRITLAATTLGRSQRCDFVISGVGISRIHAKIVQGKDGGLVIRDEASSNGTFVNDERIEEQTLTDGDLIQLGDAAVLKFRMQDELEQAAQTHLYQAAVRDALTGTYNRRHFEEELARAVSHAVRHGAALSVVLLDIDHFKSVNDTYGHQAGDEALKRVATRCSSTIRSEDVLCRVGGEEFAVIARSTTLDRVMLLAERLRQNVANERWTFDGNSVSLTLSLGVASFERSVRDNAQAIVAAADRALYHAKNGGRNRVCAADAVEPMLTARPN